MLLTALIGAPASAQPFDDPYTSIGPNGSGPRYAGRIRDLVVHPQTGTLWAGAASGGLWSSRNGGGTWRQANDFLPSLAVSSIALDPGNSRVMYAGTGEIHMFLHNLALLNLPMEEIDGLIQRSPKRGAGILKTSDTGSTWSLLPSTVGFDYVSEVAVSPMSSKLVLAATEKGLFRSSDSGSSWNAVTGPGSEIFLQVDIDSDGMAVASSLSGMFYSSDPSLLSWTRSRLPTGLTGDLRFISRPWPAVGAGVWITTVVQRSGAPHRLLVSNNGGRTFSFLPGAPRPVTCPTTGTSAATLANNNLYTGLVWPDPVKPDNLILGGVTLCRSTDRGVTWSVIDSRIHNDHHAVVADPRWGDRVYLATDGGVFRVDDYAGTPATTSLNRSLVTHQVHSADLNQRSGVVYVGMQDIGTFRRSGAGSWAALQDGGAAGTDGTHVETDPRDSRFWYFGASRGRVRRIPVDAAGAANQRIGCSSPNLLADMFRETNCNPNVVTPPQNLCPNNTRMLLDPTDSETLYVGCNRLWRTRFAKAAPQNVSWEPIKIADGQHMISAMAVAPSRSSVMWVGTYLENSGRPAPGRGRVWMTTGLQNLPTNPATGWRFVSRDEASFPDRPISSIAVDPERSFVAYVAYRGWSSDPSVVRVSVVRSQVTVEDVSRGLPEGPISTVAVHPERSDWIYAGTEVGLYVSKNRGATWSQTSMGPAHVTVSDLKWIDSSTLLVSTYGRGAFEYSLPSDRELVHMDLAWTLTGQRRGGQIENLLEQDTRSLEFRPSNGSVRAQFSGLASSPVRLANSRLEVSTVSRRNGSGLLLSTVEMEAFNFGTRRWVTLGRRTIGAGTNSIRFSSSSDARSFVHASGRVYVRSTWSGLRGGSELDALVVRIRPASLFGF